MSENEKTEIQPVHVFVGIDNRCINCDRRPGGMKTPVYCEGK